MKNSSLILIVSLYLFSCANETNSDNLTDKNNTPAAIQIESTEDNSIVDTESEQISEEIINLDSEVLDETNPSLQGNTTVESILEETITEIENEVIIEETSVEESSIEEIKNNPNHDSWNTVLKSNVSSSGKVNYEKMKAQITEIESYISYLESLSDQTSWNRNEKLAYWINLYNAATVRLIIQNYPTSSITNINGGKPWDKKVVTISGKTYSLNQIENEIIRPTFKEPRIHFAVNCAAVSCPKLMNSAFTADKLNYQLTKQAKSFINGSKNSISENTIEISKIFEWYAEDFGSSIIDYLNTYSTTTINSNALVSYSEYNWNLNK